MTTFPIRLRLGSAQAEEIDYQRDVAVDTGEEYPHVDEWRIEGTTLVVDNLDAAAEALYRITSGRDIARDNAEYVGGSEAAKARSLARGLQSATDRLVAAVGGRDAVPEYARNWL